LIGRSLRNPLLTTTLGTGELILDAISRGAKTIMLGIGGTATNDAGIGMAQALGYRFLDKKGEQLKPTGQNLINIKSIDRPEINRALENISFVALCDVENPLYGFHGAAYTYASQKGASEDDIEVLDEGLRNFETAVKQSLRLSADFAGAGAGGGLASGAKVFLGATIRKAMDYVAKVTGLDEKIRNADLVITGEGKIDRQTLSGKVVGTVAGMAMRHNKKVIAVCGICELREVEISKLGISKVISLTDPFTEPEVAMREARELVVRKVVSET
jgi:glycerate kinase